MDRPLPLQKVCDIYDFFHPEIDEFLRQDLRSTPFGSRRAWEFATIYRALRLKCKIHPSSSGLAMGAGTERLIYAIAPKVAKTLVTDLYLPDSGWVGVRTDNPLDLVMSKAPWPVDRARVDACAMDMRDLKLPDNSFDFCWSTGAFEHIGVDADFDAHLAEVHRVLKPGGVYAFTTAVVFGDKTLDIPHNHYFHPEHLIDILHRSPLHAEPEFDCHVADHLFNRPHIERFQDFGFAAGSQISKPIVSFRRGALLAANVMVLTKDDTRAKSRPTVVGFDSSCHQLRRHVKSFSTHLWRNFQVLAVEQAEDHGHVQPQYFGEAEIEVDVILGPEAPRQLVLSVKGRAVDAFHQWADAGQLVARRGRVNRLRFKAHEGHVYAMHLRSALGLAAGAVVVRARQVSAAGQAARPGPTSPFSTRVRRVAAYLGRRVWVAVKG
jgi:SAM-dependent methyltransferase